MPLMRSMSAEEAAAAFAAAYKCPGCGAGAEVVPETLQLRVHHAETCQPEAESANGWFRKVDGKVLCQRDHVIASEADITQTQGRRRCRRCHNERNGRSARKMAAERRAQRPEVPCLRCGTAIDQALDKRRPRIYCSKGCKRGAFGSNSDYKQRATKHGRRYERINRLRIFNRDGWVCGLCHEPVDRELDGLDPWGPTLDHIVPFAEGGDHVESNVHLAHRACNVVKQNTTPEEFRRWLYGPAAEEVA